MILLTEYLLLEQPKHYVSAVMTDIFRCPCSDFKQNMKVELSSTQKKLASKQQKPLVLWGCRAKVAEGKSNRCSSSNLYERLDRTFICGSHF